MIYSSSANASSAYIYNTRLILKNSTQYLLEFFARDGARYAIYDPSNDAHLASNGSWKFSPRNATGFEQPEIIDPGLSSSDFGYARLAFTTLPSNVSHVQLRFYPKSGGGTSFVDDVSLVEFNDFSQFAWLRLSNATQGMIFHSMGSENGSEQGFSWSYSGGKIWMNYSSAYNSTGKPASLGIQLPLQPDGDWHHVGITASRRGNYTLYLDGKAVGGGDFSRLGRLNATGNFTIGSAAGLPSFQGLIDEVRFYSRAIPPSEALRIFEGEYQEKCKVEINMKYATGELSEGNYTTNYNAQVRLLKLLPQTFLSMPFDINMSNNSKERGVTDYGKFALHGSNINGHWKESGKVGGAYSFCEDEPCNSTPLFNPATNKSWSGISVCAGCVDSTAFVYNPSAALPDRYLTLKYWNPARSFKFSVPDKSDSAALTFTMWVKPNYSIEGLPDTGFRPIPNVSTSTFAYSLFSLSGIYGFQESDAISLYVLREKIEDETINLTHRPQTLVRCGYGEDLNLTMGNITWNWSFYPNPLPEGQWSFLAMRVFTDYNETYADISVNGEDWYRSFHDYNCSLIKSQDSDLLIGGHGYLPYKGMIDEVNIYSTLLSHEELNRVYSGKQTIYSGALSSSGAVRSHIPQAPSQGGGGGGTPCGGETCGDGQVCCGTPSSHCIDSTWTCDACGGCEPGAQQCCEAFDNTCISSELTCDACGGICDPKTEQCCDKGETPACIPNEWTCDACGGCDPKKGFCCHDIEGKYSCMAYGEMCKDLCGGKCNYKEEFCCDATSICMKTGETCEADACGGACLPGKEQCCEAFGNTCISSELTCDACGGICDPKTEQCCDKGETPACISNEWTCDACGGICDPKTEQCCDRGEIPLCISSELTCDACGGACLPGKEQCCEAFGNTCIPSELTCDACGGICDSEKEECCELYGVCTLIGECE